MSSRFRRRIRLAFVAVFGFLIESVPVFADTYTISVDQISTLTAENFVAWCS